MKTHADTKTEEKNKEVNKKHNDTIAKQIIQFAKAAAYAIHR